MSGLSNYPACTQRPENVPLWSYFGRDVPDHNRTKIERIMFFNLFWLCNVCSTLGMRKYRKISPKTYFMDNYQVDVLRTSQGCHAAVLLWELFITFLVRFCKTERIWVINFLVSNTHIWWTKTESFSTDMRFVLTFKMDVLRTFRDRYPPDVTLGPLYDVFRLFLQKPKTIKQLFLWYFRHRSGKIKLKIMQWKCICTRR